MPGLLDPYTLKDVTLRNRIVASPMCQYMAQDGLVNDWHQTHYTTLAKGGAGLVILEATAVSAEGRITAGDLGIWKDEHISGLSSVAQAITSAGAIAGIQLGHAGRKAGCTPPWQGGAPIPASDPQAWQPIAPSELPFMPEAPHLPQAMALADIHRVQQDFVQAALRARAAGFEWLELHFAHGFLAQNFLAARSNTRDDAYGGTLQARARFLLETVAAVRKVWPASLPLTVRLGVLEYAAGEEASLAEAMQVLRWLKEVGLDFVDVGLSLATAAEQVPWAPNLMVPYAARIRRECGIPVGTSWSITQARDADAFVRDEKLDLVFLARTLLANPHWPYQAARALGIDAPASVLPTPYAYWLATWQP
ncbi:2,4-dienoyl-CoA reductase-like NADH-dependent reductase (Old Yellow Enzyme family) [Comamonas sp. BIGb0152]|uniref:NADH:flavin oxidoreductase/NADH oxidase n=1 Tax=Comamonas sp. BIGb0152 TaxID=2940601 RepID=UPI0021698265|nr:NADH:flavin oxidoreductase/NADH oxidase [Comamonas sp. BIGb0152]MCS4292052.1 2,4-dienoyl-CoA reductase-like NADH-dependent reductase (Old Yellow Enzyme family) [Comamonas sp. BIGb0152]